MKKRNISTAQAAKILGMGEQNLRKAMQKKELPIGCAFKAKGRHYYSYHISRKLFEEYIGPISDEELQEQGGE